MPLAAAQTQETSTDLRRNAILISVTILLLVIASGVANAIRKDVTRGFDELAHVSYIADIQRARTSFPDIRALTLLDPKTFAPTDTKSYLNHPAIYYAGLAAFGPALNGHPEALLPYRIVNVILIAVALAALLSLAYSVSATKLEFYALAVPLATIPTLLALSGAVNNDNLAIAGGCIAMWGVERWLASDRRTPPAAVLVGTVMAGWAKFTALLLVGGCVTLVVGYLAWRRRGTVIGMLAVAAALGAAAIPYLVFVMQYGSPVPEVPGHIQMMQEGAREMGWADRRLTLPAYIGNFASVFVTQFMPALEARSILNALMLIVPVSVMALSLAGASCAALRLLRGKETRVDVLTIAGWIAIGLVLTAHVRFGYRNHLATGWLLDAYPRYYLPLCAVSVLGCLCLLTSIGSARARGSIIGFLIVGPPLFNLLGAPVGG